MKVNNAFVGVAGNEKFSSVQSDLRSLTDPLAMKGSCPIFHHKQPSSFLILNPDQYPELYLFFFLCNRKNIRYIFHVYNAKHHKLITDLPCLVCFESFGAFFRNEDNHCSQNKRNRLKKIINQ